jgi:hypothetical protein
MLRRGGLAKVAGSTRPLKNGRNFEAHARDHSPGDGMLRKVGMSRIPFCYGRKCEVIEWREHQTTMSQYEADVIKLLTQIMDELRRIRISLEERDRIQQEENEDLLKRIEKTHRGPTSE